MGILPWRNRLAESGRIGEVGPSAQRVFFLHLPLFALRAQRGSCSARPAGWHEDKRDEQWTTAAHGEQPACQGVLPAGRARAAAGQRRGCSHERIELHAECVARLSDPIPSHPICDVGTCSPVACATGPASPVKLGTVICRLLVSCRNRKVQDMLAVAGKADQRK